MALGTAGRFEITVNSGLIPRLTPAMTNRIHEQLQTSSPFRFNGHEFPRLAKLSLRRNENGQQNCLVIRISAAS